LYNFVVDKKNLPKGRLIIVSARQTDAAKKRDFMKKLKALGIIALTALIIFGVTGCPEENGLDEEVYELTGTVSISPSAGAFVGDDLTATYVGEGNSFVDFFWYVDGEFLESGSSKVTAKKAGVYSVVARGKGLYDESEVEGTNTVTVTVHDANDLFGTWKTSAKFHPEGAPVNSQHDETITITRTSFKLVSTWNGDGYTGTTPQYGDDDDTDAEFEYFEYTITGWVPLTGDSLKVDNVTYTKAFRLALSNWKTKGYTKLTAFNLYLLTDADGKMSIRRSRESSNTNNIILIERTYNKQ